MKENIEKIKDLKAVCSGALEAGELSIANIIKCGIDLIEKSQEENGELKRLIAHRNGYAQQLEKDLFENCSNYVISKQKIKDKIEEYKSDGIILDTYPNFSEQEVHREIVEILQDLLESEDK